MLTRSVGSIGSSPRSCGRNGKPGQCVGSRPITHPPLVRSYNRQTERPGRDDATNRRSYHCHAPDRRAGSQPRECTGGARDGHAAALALTTSVWHAVARHDANTRPAIPGLPASRPALITGLIRAAGSYLGPLFSLLGVPGADRRCVPGQRNSRLGQATHPMTGEIPRPERPHPFRRARAVRCASTGG
jgi:hypothetical protein